MSVPCLDCHDALLMTIDANDGSLHSPISIQKLGYFYTKKIGTFDAKYVPYFYGPFSNEVASALTDLSAFSFVNEIAYSGFYGGYTYELTKMGMQHAANVSERLAGERRQIADILKVCDDHCDLKPAPLSYAAKCHHILSIDGKKEYSAEDIKQAGRGLHWDISEDDIADGTRLLQELRLDKPGISS